MIYSVIFIFALIIANLLVAWIGPWFSIVNAFVLIGLDLTIRDKLHESWKNDRLILKMGGLILISSLVSYFINFSVRNTCLNPHYSILTETCALNFK